MGAARALRAEAQGARHRPRTQTAPDASLPAGTDLLPQIEHIVVLMMENTPTTTTSACCGAAARACRSRMTASLRWSTRTQRAYPSARIICPPPFSTRRHRRRAGMRAVCSGHMALARRRRPRTAPTPTPRVQRKHRVHPLLRPAPRPPADSLTPNRPGPYQNTHRGPAQLLSPPLVAPRLAGAGIPGIRPASGRSQTGPGSRRTRNRANWRTYLVWPR